jgi:lipoprotein NlpI
LIMSAWHLVKNGQYAQAVAAFSEAIETDPSTADFNNRGVAYLHLGDFDAALADFRSAEALSSSALRTAGDGEKCGVALWMSGRNAAAIDTWSAGVEASLRGEVRYGDAAGGVTIGNLLLFAGVRTDRPEVCRLATRLLRKRLRTKQSAAWPGPVSRYLLGQISEPDLLAAVTTDPILRERQMCQARFYAGVRALSDGDTVGYHSAVQEAVEFGRVSKLEAEYYLALHESRQAQSP